jgi:hypothetical protein
MEKTASEIPIYKICHIRSPDEAPGAAPSSSASSSSLSPEYNILYVFYGNVEFTNDEGAIVNINDIFRQERENPFFQTIFSEYELQVIKQTDINVVFLPERIYPDDSIETIKKKFLYLTRDKVGLSYAELFLFCKQVKHLTTQMAHDHITSNGKLEFTPIRLENYLLNIENQPTGAAGGATGYQAIANLKLEEKPRIVNVAMGQELSIAATHEYPYTVNPFDAMSADPFLEIHASEIVNTTNKTVLVDYGVFLHNTIYLVAAEDALVYANDVATAATAATAATNRTIYESYMIRVYFPYLSTFRDDTRRSAVEIGSAEASGEIDLATIHSRETLMLHKLALFDADKKILNERFLRQTSNIKLFYDIYERRTTEQKYIDDGIRGVEFLIHPETPYNQSLDAVFKMIHCSEYIPYIKYNQGKKRDNIYKLYISGVSRSGRKIPYLPKGDIFRLIKTTARKKSVAMYINYTYSNPEVPNHKATHLPISVLCEFYPDGSVYVKLFAKFSFTTAEMENIIKATVNPILRVIKEHVEQSGFQMTLFTKLYHPQIELINLEYFAQLAITKNIEIKQMITCISSAFNEIEGSLKKGIVLRYKRVSNYNDMSSQDAYIIEMLNKRQSDNDIMEGLRSNYMMSESEARSKFATMLSSLQTQHFSRFRGGAIRIKNNPGFLTKITKGAFNNIITMEVSNINNILFLPAIHIYLDSILRIYQSPGTTEIPYEKIAELCKTDAPNTKTTATREEAIEVMPEIVPVVKKTSSASGSGSAPGSVSAPAPPVFGFEAEVPKEEEIDLFDLLQDDDGDDGDDAGDGGDDAKENEQGGGGGRAKATEHRHGEGESEEEDLSDITGMELANPNPFSKRIQERDPAIHLNEDVGKFNAYSRSCPWNVRRQPVILTSEEKARIDREHPDSYSHSITYGSDPNKQYHYICPRYWSLKHNTSLTEDEVKSGKFGAIIPQKAKKIPAGANIFEFTDDKYHKDENGNYKQHYPGFLGKDKHPKGLCVPCCFANWDKPSQTMRRNECQAKQFESVQIKESTASAAEGTATTVTTAATAAEGTGATTTTAAATAAVSEPVKINEMKDDRILSSDKFPLENNRWGYLPIQVQKFLFSDSRNCQVSLKNTSLKKDTPCLLRRGVETNERQSFVSVIAYFYKESIGSSISAYLNAPIQSANPPKIQESIASMITEESMKPAATAASALKDRIAKTIAENIQQQSLLISRKLNAKGNDPSRSMENPGSAKEDTGYHSEDEAPVAMTPRPYSSGVTSGVTSAMVPTIREMRNIIIQSLTIDNFMTFNNGTLTDVFYNPNNEVREIDLVNKYDGAGLRGLNKETFARVCNAYENFIAYLDDDTSVIDHTYLWDIVCRPNERLFKSGNNIILIHIPDDDITNNVQVICPTNAYSGEVFDTNRKTIIIMKRDTYYEPIYLFESKSNGKFSVLGRFALKSKTLMPKIRHAIENIRDIYFAYCRLHASQPREYKYKMNMPAEVIAKLVKDAGFNILAQVLNFNGKVIGLQISQTLSITKLNPTAVVKKSIAQKEIKGVIPTAVSARLSASDIPTVLMNDDETLWTMSYRETVDFFETVARQIKKTTKKDLYCRVKVKVVEDGLIVGVITETNQFIQVNIDKDPQLNQDDGIPTITESNHLIADKEVALAGSTEASRDKTRERYIRNIRLETNFYNVFRNTARNVLNRPENKAKKDDIEKLIASPFVLYQNKLSQIIAHLKQMLAKYVAFIRYSKTTLKMVGEISGCITNDDDTCGKKSYCLKETGGFCKLLIPQRNLMYPDIDNEVAYFGKVADEMIRYERVKLFMFEPTKYISFQDIKYNLQEDEIILLESFITQEYFENMEPADENPYVFQTNFYTVAPSNAGARGVQNYDPVYRKEYIDRYLEITSGAAAATTATATSGATSGAAAATSGAAAAAATSGAAAAAATTGLQVNEINHILDFCHQVSKRKITEKMRKEFFQSENAYEILFSNESNECSFDVILTILRVVAQNASKCPSGHSCVPHKQSGPAEPESEICGKCRESIGSDQTDYLCRQCNYFVCEHCRIQHVDELAEMTIPRLKSILVSEYGKLSESGLDKKLTMILNGYGMKKYANLIQEGRATLPQIIQSENYFLTNIDIWILAMYFKIPIALISQSLLSENGENMMVLYGGNDAIYGYNNYFFIHPFTVTQDIPTRYGLIEVKHNDISLLTIPLEFLSLNIRNKIENYDTRDLRIEEYIQNFKLSLIKHKKRVFTFTEPPIAAAALPENTDTAMFQ